MIVEFMKNKYSNFILHKLLIYNAQKKEYKVMIDLIQKNLGNIHINKFKNQWQMFLDKAPEQQLIDDDQQFQNPYDDNEFQLNINSQQPYQ